MCILFHPLKDGQSGSCGALIKTVDGGMNWTNSTTYTGYNFESVLFYDKDFGIALTPGNIIFTTTTGGYTWTPQSHTIQLFDICIVDSMTLIVTGFSEDYGGVILRSTNKGTSWNYNYLNLWDNIKGVHFIDNLNLAAVTQNGLLLKSTDAGLSWIEHNLDTVGLRDILFYGENYGIISGDNGVILRTTNKGQDWIPVHSGTSKNLTRIRFYDEFTGYISSYNSLLKTTDGGNSWTSTLLPAGINSVFPIGKDTLIAVGSSGKILKSFNAASSWEIISRGSLSSLNYAKFFDEDNGIAAGISLILSTSNGGADWKEQFTGITQNINSIFFINKFKGWYVGNSGTILHTSDGGKTWLEQQSFTDRDLMDVFFIDENRGIIVGAGIILKTTDGGENWFLGSVVTNAWFRRVYFSDPDFGLVAGITSGWKWLIQGTTDGGIDWDEQYRGSGGEMYNMFFVNRNTGWILGRDRILLKTNDSGLNWEDMNLNMPCLEGSNVMFVDENNGILNCGGNIYLTYDGGTTWRHAGINNCYINYAVMINTETAYTVGDNSTIYKLNFGSITGVENSQDLQTGAAEDFYLSQCYPNPFNPDTKIRFYIPVQQYVEIKIFDVLGNEAGIICMENLPPGSYERQWNGSGLSSGIYYYRMKAGNFVQTKKMALIK
jgi:photosystem II stability/assembly factor-like uncharacterized protein